MSENQIDQLIVEAVENIRDRFGPPGLADLIALAQRELTSAEEALQELSDSTGE